jgi:hypothetical protein
MFHIDLVLIQLKATSHSGIIMHYEEKQDNKTDTRTQITIEKIFWKPVKNTGTQNVSTARMIKILE